MKYYNPKIRIPYFDMEGMKQYIQLSIEGTVDRRRLYRGTRKYIKEVFDKKVSKEWIKVHCTIVGLTDVGVAQARQQMYDPKHQEQLDALCIALMQEADNETEDNASSGVQEGSAG